MENTGHKKRNCFGKEIINTYPILEDNTFGVYDEFGEPHPYWTEENDIVDKIGFDKRNIEQNGEYIIRYVLPKGTLLCRYGHDGGRITTIQGTPYETLGLPYVKDSMEYHEYCVRKDTEVDCVVTKGIAAPMFNSIGGGLQFLHDQKIWKEISDGKLEEVYGWIK